MRGNELDMRTQTVWIGDLFLIPMRGNEKAMAHPVMTGKTGS